MKRREFLSAAAAASAAALAGGGAARAEDKVKWAVFTPDREVTYLTVMRPYAEAVQRATSNALTFEFFPNGGLGRNPAQQPQLVLDGVADIAWVIPSYTPGRFAENEVLELPGVFNNLREATTVSSRLIQRNVLRGYDDFFVIGLFCTAPYSIHTNFPVNTIADLRGKKIRASSAIESAGIRALGAVPVGMPVTEIPEAMSRRAIDGATSHMSPLFDFGLDRVTNNHFFIRLGVVPLAILMSKRRFDALPAAAQAALRQHAGEGLGNTFSDSIGRYNDELLQRLRDNPRHRVVVPSDAEQAAAQQALAAVRDEWVARTPRNRELKAELDAELARVRAATRS